MELRPPELAVEREPDLTTSRGEYGVDAPYAPFFFAVGFAICLAQVVFAARAGRFAIAPSISAGWFLLMTASYLYTTRAGKFAVWAGLLRGLELEGDERVLDMGCGRGAVLMLAAKLLPRGRAIGVDLWSTKDQSGNRAEATRRNAEREGVAERVDLHTGDMRELPFEDASFDVVVSSLAIHNIGDAAGRDRAIEQAARVLKPGGRLLIADIRHARRYAERLRSDGLQDVQVRSLGWRFWYGGPWAATTLVTARK